MAVHWKIQIHTSYISNVVFFPLNLFDINTNIGKRTFLNGVKLGKNHEFIEKYKNTGDCTLSCKIQIRWQIQIHSYLTNWQIWQFVEKYKYISRKLLELFSMLWTQKITSSLTSSLKMNRKWWSVNTLYRCNQFS